MTLILLQTMIQSIASTLNWVGFYVGIRSLPGDLFPVNSIGERHVPSLFSTNRRVAIVVDTPSQGRVTVVMVGAMINVLKTDTSVLQIRFPGQAAIRQCL